MKKLLLTAVSTAAIAIAAPAYAQSTSTISQGGIGGHTVTVDQTGETVGSKSDILQTGVTNTATVTQSDDGSILVFPANMADIDQTGDNNTATIVQDAETSLVVNTSIIEQTEDRNVAISRQFDDGQISNISQTSNSNRAEVLSLIHI